MTASEPYQAGYDRDCDPGACVFGMEWTDDNTTRFGHNGCDTRQDVLLQQMHDIELRWGSRCRIYQARMRDPYTGRQADLAPRWLPHPDRPRVPTVASVVRRGLGVVRQKRVNFANNVDGELVATWGPANQAKGVDPGRLVAAS